MKARQRNKLIKKHNIVQSVVVMYHVEGGGMRGEWLSFNLKKKIKSRHDALNYNYMDDIPRLEEGQEGIAQLLHFDRKKGMYLKANYQSSFDENAETRTLEIR